MADDAAPLAIGTVLARAFGVMTGNPVTVFALAFLVGALPPQLFALLLPTNTNGDTSVFFANGALYLVYFILLMVGAGLAQGALIRATSAQLDGRSASIGESLSAGLAKALPILGVSILTTLGVFVGFALLVIPGIILALMWAVAIPALVEEDIGVFASLGRSRHLTKGARWQILFLIIVALVIMWLMLAIVAVPAFVLGLSDPSPARSVGEIVVGLITSTLSTALWATVVTSLYFALRERRDGPRAEALANVFA